VNGLTPNPLVTNAPLELYSDLGWSIAGVSQANLFVLEIGLLVPTKLQNNFGCDYVLNLCYASFSIFNVYPTPTGGITGQAFGGVVYVSVN
jgi:hypothetical protein